MSTNRMIKDSFWTDSYIENLDPIEKLLYIYLLTNPLCNIAGIYQIQTRRIAFEIGIDKEMVEKLLNRLSDDGKIIRHSDWMIIINHAKHQSFKNPNVTAGIKRIIDDLPEEVKALKGFERLAHFTLLNLTLPNSTIPNVSEPVVVKDLVLAKEVNKEKYGQFDNVLLEAVEYQKLVAEYGDGAANALIEELSNYIASTGKRYKSHYATLLNWARRKIQEHAVKSKSFNTPKLTADFSK